MSNPIRNIIKSFIAVLCFLVASDSSAQNLNVLSFEESMEVMSAAMQKKDLNGFICPLVKVQLPVQGVKFQGNVVDVIFDVNEYLVYLSPNSKILAVKCPGFKTLKVYFGDYQIPAIQAKRIYILDLDTNATLNQSVIASSEPGADNEGSYGTADSNNVSFGGNSDVVVPASTPAARSGDEELWTVFFDKNGKAGYGSTSGEIFIPAQFDDAGEFSEGMAAVKKNGKWGFIDRTGAVVIPCKYDGVRPFSDGSAIGEFNRTGNGKDNKGYCIIDPSGKEITPIYDDAGFFHDDRAVVGQNGKFGYVNRQGKVAIPIIYDWAAYFVNGYADIQLKGKYGIIDINGKETVPAIYDKMESNESPSGQLIAAFCKGEKYGYINMNGSQITKFEFEEAEPFESSEFTIVGNNDKYGIIDTKGRKVVPIKYDDLEIMEIYNGSEYAFSKLAVAEKNEKYGIINMKNKTIVPFTYDDINWTDSNGLIRVELDGKYGYINSKGDVIIPIKYENAAFEFSNEIGLVKLNDKWGGVNSKGETVIPFIYDSPHNNNWLPSADTNGLITLKLNGKVGCVNAQGDVQIPFIYDKIFSFRKGRALVKLGNDNFIINENGKRISEVNPNNSFWP